VHDVCTGRCHDGCDPIAYRVHCIQRGRFTSDLNVTIFPQAANIAHSALAVTSGCGNAALSRRGDAGILTRCPDGVL
jgi:hypothetical protein